MSKPPKELLEILRRLEALSPQRPPIYLDDTLLELFLKFSQAERHNTPKWINAQRRLLTWWAARLHQVDLRKASLEQHIHPALDAAPGSRTHRIAVLKRLYSWLRKERHQLTPAEDPTFGTLSVPQATPAQWTTPRTVTQSEYRAARLELSSHWRAALDVLAATGWHFSELERFVRGGSIRRTKRGVVLTCPRTKRGPPLRTRVPRWILQPAMYLRQRGTISEKRFRLALRGSRCRVTPGCMRHSVATFAVDQAGETPAAVSAFLGHQSERTTKLFYATHAIPRKVKTLADR